jgi:hypothetical protein
MNWPPRAWMPIPKRCARLTDGIIGDAKQWAKVPIIDWRGNDNWNIHELRARVRDRSIASTAVTATR